MSATRTGIEAPAAAGDRGRHRPTRRRGRILRFFGKTLLFAAFLLAAYIAWVLWGTGLYTEREQAGLRNQITTLIEDPRPEPRAVRGDAYAIMEIPSIDLDTVVVQGTDLESLKRGPGHYPETADPWDDSGRVGVAGHRTTYGQPFWDLDRVQPGDPVVLHTERGRFEYRTRRTFEVSPDAVEVLRQTNRPTLVLTTCAPKFSAARRLILVAEQIDAPEPGEPRLVTVPTPEPQAAGIPPLVVVGMGIGVLLAAILIVAWGRRGGRRAGQPAGAR